MVMCVLVSLSCCSIVGEIKVADHSSQSPVVLQPLHTFSSTFGLSKLQTT